MVELAWTTADWDVATGFTTATKKTARDVAVAAMKTTMHMTGERLRGAPHMKSTCLDTVDRD